MPVIYIPLSSCACASAFVDLRLHARQSVHMGQGAFLLVMHAQWQPFNFLAVMTQVLEQAMYVCTL